MCKLSGKTFVIIILVSILFSCDDGYTLLKSGDELKPTSYVYTDTYRLVSVPVPVGGITFPIGYDDSDTASVEKKYLIGDSEVTVGLWYTIANWATYEKEGEKYSNIYVTKHKYYEPKAMKYSINDVGFIQILIWCNAYTEWHNYSYGTNLTPVYTDKSGKPLRTAMTPLNPNFAGVYPNKFLEIYFDYINTHEGIEDYLKTKTTAGNGFRLPTHHEWELAARWNGTDSINTVTSTINGTNFAVQTIKFTKGNSASGAKDSVSNLYEMHKYGYFRENSNLNLTVQLPKRKLPNVLGLYDMSGNVAEYVYNVEYINLQGVIDMPFAMAKGGSYLFVFVDPPLENVESLAIGRYILTDAAGAYNYSYGFRTARDDE